MLNVERFAGASKIRKCLQGVFPKIGKHPNMDGENNGISENPIEMDDLGVFPHYFSETSISIPQKRQKIEIKDNLMISSFIWVHPGRLTWNIIIGVWKIIFLSKWVFCMFHVNLPGCKFLQFLNLNFQGFFLGGPSGPLPLLFTILWGDLHLLNPGIPLFLVAKGSFGRKVHKPSDRTVIEHFKSLL